MELFEIGRIASRFDTRIAHAMLHAVAVAVNEINAATRCMACTLCAVELPPGFASPERLYCTDRRCYVDPYDGCTFGNPGALMTARADIDATILGDLATG